MSNNIKSQQILHAQGFGAAPESKVIYYLVPARSRW